MCRVDGIRGLGFSIKVVDLLLVGCGVDVFRGLGFSIYVLDL